MEYKTNMIGSTKVKWLELFSNPVHKTITKRPDKVYFKSAKVTILEF